jgi:transcriptional regulator with XRE-family HTH domain
VPSISVGSLGEYIREQREQAEVSLRQLARTAGVSNPYLSQVERGLKRPSAEILQQIAQGLRISAETLYVRAGLLEERDGERVPTVAAAVTADPDLTQRQKRALMDVYEAFRRENDAAADAAASAATSSPAASAKPGNGSRRPRSTTASARKRSRSSTPRSAAPENAPEKE